MKLWDVPTVWTHPSGIEGVDVTEYWDYGHPELLPIDSRSRTYINHRTDPNEPVSIPTRATNVIERPEVRVNGKVTEAATYKREVVSYTEYAGLVRAREVAMAGVVVEGLPVPTKGEEA